MNCELKVPVLSVEPLGETSAPPWGVLNSTVAPAIGILPAPTCTTILTSFPFSGDPETGSKVTDITDGRAAVVTAVVVVFGGAVVVDVTGAVVGAAVVFVVTAVVVL